MTISYFISELPATVYPCELEDIYPASRINVKTTGVNHAETALSDAVDYCIENGILAEFLKKNRAEVLGMLLEEFDAEKYERTLRSEGKEEGRKEGKEEGIEEEREDGIRYMIEVLQELGQSVDCVKEKLKEKYSLSEKEAQGKQQLYWK